MTEDRISVFVETILGEIEEKSRITEHFVDKDHYRIFLATIWSNLVLEPSSAGIDELDLELIYDSINSHAHSILGGDDPLKETYHYLTTKDGEAAMDKAKLTKNHKDLLVYFASMMLDPEGHKKWLEDVRSPNN